MSDSSPSRWPMVVVALLAVILFVALCRPYWTHLVDDAFISFRYARNLNAGEGLVFNPGERVEGYTNFLWTVLVALGMRLGIDPAVGARWGGLLASVGILVAVAVQAAVMRRPGIRGTWGALLAPVLLGVTFTFTVWATAGLETPLFTLLLVIGVWLTERAMRVGSVRTLQVGAISLGLSGLTRPDGILFFAVAGLWTLVVAARRGTITRRRVVATFAVALALTTLPHTLWRIAIYGDLLPNTFHAKVGAGDGLSGHLARGLDYSRDFLQDLRWWALVPLAGLLATVRRRWHEGAGLGLSPLVVIVMWLGILYVGGDGLTAYRFFHPMLPFLMVGVALGVAELSRMVRGAIPRTGPAAAVLLTVGLSSLCLGALLLPHAGGRALRAVEIETNEVAAWTAIGKWFRAEAEPDQSIAVIVAGAIPYFSELPTIDLLGLNDRTIARHPISDPGRGQAGHERSHPAYVLERDPDFVVIGEYRLHDRVNVFQPDLQLFYRAERELATSEPFQERYRVRAGETPQGLFYYFERRR